MSKKVLIVDDEPALLSLVQTVLQSGGFEVHACESGRLAWEEIVRVKPDVLMLDVMLPGVDGFTLMNQISADESTKSIPVLLFTSFESAHVLFGKFPQIADFLIKPVEPAVLLKAVGAAAAKSAD
jgi:DNA-binding response OmpR family regulator